MRLPRTVMFALAALGAATCGCVDAAAQERVLTTALEVRSLSRADAERKLPARIRGIVVFIESPSAIFVQDATSTTFFRTDRRALPSVGDEIEIEARTRMGLYLPGLESNSMRILGRRELPPGIPAHYDDLHFGRYHYQRVAVEGIVRSVLPLPGGKSVVRLAMGSRVIELRVEAPPPDQPPIDHHVRATGLAAGLINVPRRQLVQPYVRLLGWRDVQILAPAPPAAEAPHISAEDLLAFNISGLGERRVRIEGVVSAAFTGEHAFLRQRDMAFAVRFTRPTTLNAGDQVVVVGFPSMERFSASVVDAELLGRAPGAPVAPFDLDSIDELYGKRGDLLPGKYDGHLVRLAVTVRDAFKNESGITLLVQSGQRTIQAHVPPSTLIPAVGSHIRLTGICQVETPAFGSGFQSRPGSVSLRATAPGDIEVLRRPSWWTPQRLTAVLAALGGVTLLAGLWIAALRRQVARQTAALRRRIESEAALEERQRIAREFHDSLEQELAGVSLRLDAVATRPIDDKGRQLIGAARSLVSRIQTETRDLISDLRDPAETAGDLAAALAAVTARLAADRGADIRFDGRASLPPLPGATVHDLRMIAREAVNNALKHGRATRVTVELERRDETIVLRIVDNGCGFDAATATQARRGHFGCAGMRERGRKIGAQVAWFSELQKGTTVEVLLPLPATNAGQTRVAGSPASETTATAPGASPHAASATPAPP